MTASKKKKPMTKAEIKQRKQIREELRAEGILPPIKPKLNRRKFAEETIAEFENSMLSYTDMVHIHSALGWILPTKGAKEKVTPEQVGVLKFLKVAIEIKKFTEEKRNDGNTTYKLQELWNRLEPIFKL